MIISGKQSMNIELSERVNLLQNASSTVIATASKHFISFLRSHVIGDLLK